MVCILFIEESVVSFFRMHDINDRKRYFTFYNETISRLLSNLIPQSESCVRTKRKILSLLAFKSWFWHLLGLFMLFQATHRPSYTFAYSFLFSSPLFLSSWKRKNCHRSQESKMLISVSLFVGKCISVPWRKCIQLQVMIRYTSFSCLQLQQRHFSHGNYLDPKWWTRGNSCHTHTTWKNTGRVDSWDITSWKFNCQLFFSRL